MEILNPTEAFFDEDFLNFTLEGEIIDEENDSKESSSSFESKTTAFGHEMNSSSFSEVVEEELEWLSNKDAFPSVETCFGILSDNPQLVPNHQSPTSVLENIPSSNNNVNTSSLASCFVGLKVPVNFPVRSRSKRRRRSRKISFSELPTQQCSLWASNQVNFIVKNRNETSSTFLSTRPPPSVGRRCLHCESDKTPQWRAGPMGPKTLCNACGVRYKSGRLLPEYRPANSPTFSSVLHSNSHRKVVEMRKQKQVVVGGGGGGEGFAAN